MNNSIGLLLSTFPRVGKTTFFESHEGLSYLIKNYDINHFPDVNSYIAHIDSKYRRNDITLISYSDEIHQALDNAKIPFYKVIPHNVNDVTHQKFNLETFRMLEGYYLSDIMTDILDYDFKRVKATV